MKLGPDLLPASVEDRNRVMTIAFITYICVKEGCDIDRGVNLMSKLCTDAQNIITANESGTPEVTD